MLSLLFIVPNLLLCANSFSSTPTSTFVKKVRQSKDHEPVILSLPDILSADQTSDMRQAIESSIRKGELVPTSSYQEDVFSKDKWEEEDGVLLRILRPLLDEQLLPSEYADDLEGDPNSALQAFVFAVTKYQNRLSEEDIILGANVIQRRQAIERWKSEDGLAIMKLSLDGDEKTEEVDWDSMSLGKRYELPPVILNELEQLIPRLLLGSWATRDATLVKYSEGDSQVPHIDPCDATLLICLKSCDEGGDTCFPSLERPIRLENREGCGALFFSSNKIEGDAGRDALSLHHGGKVLRGEKMVVQLMLDWHGDLIENGGNPVPGSWLDVVVSS